MAQQQRKQKAAPGMKGFYLLLGGLALAGAGILAWVFAGRGGAPVTEPVPLDLETTDLQALITRAQGVELGSPDAPVRVIEFADYQCPGCAVFGTQLKPILQQRYIDTGRIRFTLFDYPLMQAHPNAFLAARAARCAGDQERYWDYHDILFGQQATWSAHRGAAVGPFVEYARQLGLDAGVFESCLRSDRHADAVTAGLRLGEEMGVFQTPTVIVNGQRVTDLRSTTDIIEQALGAD